MCAALSIYPHARSSSDAHGTSITVIHRKGKTRQERDDNATLPRRALSVRSNDAMDNSVADPVLDLHVVNNRPTPRSGSLRERMFERLTT